MKTLVVIPSLMHKYSFSAPLAWLFSDNIDCVTGIYSYKLDKSAVMKYSSFIVELNWFIELMEFELITNFIKKHNPDSKILFGGLYSQIKYKEIFDRYPVDFFIRGDAELPMKLYLENVDPREIPNMTGRDFENEQTYIFKQEDLQKLQYDIDWIPEYRQLMEDSAKPSDTIELSFNEMPLYPRYWDKKSKKVEPHHRWRVPPKGGTYHLPMIITARGTCQAAHDGCDYCMGSKTREVQEIYRRPALIIDNETLVSHLKNIEKKYKNASIYINSKFDFDLRGHFFDLNVTIDVDSPCTAENLKNIISAFKNAVVHLAIYNEGLTGREVRNNIDEFRRLEDDHHKIYFFTLTADSDKIPQDRRLYAEFILPHWTSWEFYNNFSNAMKKSREWYFVTGQTNFYPLPRRIISGIISFSMRHILYVLNKLGIIDFKKKVF